MRILSFSLFFVLSGSVFALGLGENEGFSLSGIRELKIEGGMLSVEVAGKNVSGVDMEVFDLPRGLSVFHEQSGSSLRVWTEKKGLFIPPGNGRLLFTVPEDILLEAVTSSGNLAVSGIDAEFLSAQSSSGSVEIDDVSGRLSCGSSSGGVRVRGGEGEKAVKTSSGTIRIEDSDGGINAESSSGSVRIASVDGDISVSTSSASIHLEDIVGSLNASSSSGGITGEQITLTGDSFFETSSGSIHVSLENDPDELRFELTTSSGGLECPLGSGGKRLSVGNGGITVTGKTSSGSQSYR